MRVHSLVPSLLLGLLASFGSVRAQADERQELVQTMEQLALTRLPSSQWPERNRKIAAWLADVEKREIDLGAHGYLKAVALYFARDYDGAGEKLFAYMEKHPEGLPNPKMKTIVGRVLLNGAMRLAEAGETERFLQAAGHCLKLYSPRRTVYAALCYRLKDNAAMRGAFHELLARALRDDELTTEDRQMLLTRCFTPTKQRTAQRKGPSALKDFEAKDLDGETQSLAKYRGKVLLVDFWATWCGPCIREMPNVVAAHRKYREQGFEVLAISLDQEPGQKRGEVALPPSEATVMKIRKKMQELGMDWPCIYEGGGWGTRLAKANGIRSIPATFLLGRDGKVRHTNLRGPALARAVAELLAEGR